MKLTLASLGVFVVMTVLALLMFNDGNMTITDKFTRVNGDGVTHYYFTVHLGDQRKALEVSEDVYAKHEYGDPVEAAWLQDLRR